MMIDFKYLFPKWGIKPKGIMHIGGSTGQERDTYIELGVPNVMWVEAIPSVFVELLKNVSPLGHSAICACLSNIDGELVEFKISNNEAQSSSMLELQHHKIIHPEVHYIDSFKTITWRFDSLIGQNMAFYPGRFDFLNIDVQGAELKVIQGMGNALHFYKYVYAEVNKRETYKGCALVEELDDYLLRYGFERVETGQWVGDTWTDALYIKKEVAKDVY